MSTDTTPLSPRHERFVAEFLKSGNATQAYIRAGYSPRGAQPSASKLLRDPRIEAAVAAGRQRITESLEVDVHRLAQEYARIAYARIEDFVTVDENGRVRIDLEKAGAAQRGGIVELKVVTNRKQEQQVTLKLGKLQALAALTKNIGVLVAKPEPGLTAGDRQRYEQVCAEYRQQLDHRKQEYGQLAAELRAARAALAEAQKNPTPRPHAEEAAERPSRSMGNEAGADCPPFETRPLGAPPRARAARPGGEVVPADTPPAHIPGMPTGPLPDHTPGLYPNAKFVWSGGRDFGHGPDSADALRTMKPGGFPGR